MYGNSRCIVLCLLTLQVSLVPIWRNHGCLCAANSMVASRSNRSQSGAWHCKVCRGWTETKRFDQIGDHHVWEQITGIAGTKHQCSLTQFCTKLFSKLLNQQPRARKSGSGAKEIRRKSNHQKSNANCFFCMRKRFLRHCRDTHY